MSKLNFNISIVDKYLRLLSGMSEEVRIYISNQLHESVKDKKPPKHIDLFGSWEDSRESSEIIKQIRDSRSFSRTHHKL